MTKNQIKWHGLERSRTNKSETKIVMAKLPCKCINGNAKILVVKVPCKIFMVKLPCKLQSCYAKILMSKSHANLLVTMDAKT